jgi:ankyrin repeat protein/beta-lactamase regulating signal transducer with metallopeptidase domain
MVNVINGIAEHWFPYMASATVQATILALAILGLLQMGRRWRPALRYALMILALCKFVIPPMLSFPTGLFSRIQPQQIAESASPLHYAAPIAQKIFSPVVNVPNETGQPLPPSSLPTPILTTNGKLLLLHLSGALLIVTLAVVQKVRLRRLASRSSEVQDLALAEAYNALSRSMKLSRKPRLLISEDNHAPIAFGLWKPVIMLPEALVASLPLSEILVVLGHELAHHRHRDLWISWLQVIVSAVWWFNPVYWLLTRSIRGVREDCCDDMVLASGLASGEDYCRTLLKAMRTALEHKALIQTDFAYLGESQPMRRRFIRIMNAKFIRAPKLALTGVLSIIALALVLLPGVKPISGHSSPDAASDENSVEFDLVSDSSPPDAIGEKIKVIEKKKIREGDALFIEGKRIIDNYLSSKGKSIDRNSTEFQNFLMLAWRTENPELNTRDKDQPVNHYLITVLGLTPDTETPMVDENNPGADSAFNRRIHDAAKAGDLAKVKALIDNLGPISSEGDERWMPLHWAASYGHKDVVQLLLANKADVNEKDEDGRTPLHAVTRKDVAQLLLAKGADVNAKDENGRTPLHNEAGWHKDVVQLLLAKGADVNAKASNGDTPLRDAAGFGLNDIVELLLAKGAEVNARDIDNFTPLHWAASGGHKDVVKLLLANKAQVNAKTNLGWTPLHMAAHYGRKAVVELLLANKAEVNAKDVKGYTPLHWAASEGRKDVVELLRQHGGHE